MNKDFNVVKVTNDLIDWIREYFQKNGPTCNAIIGISGGKDSTVCAGLLVEALGKDRVIGVTMPNGFQDDIEDSIKVTNFLGIRRINVNIYDTYRALMNGVEDGLYGIGLKREVSDNTKINMPPRLRMTTLFAVSQTLNGRVVNTCNLSEDWVGYSTLFGDAAGQFSPLGKLTVEEIIAIGDYLGLPRELVHKTPSDGLCNKTDEDNLGFRYSELDDYINTGVMEDNEKKQLIDKKHRANLFKYKPMPTFDPKIERALQFFDV